MGFLNAISNSIKSFSKNCFEDMKNKSPKYAKSLSNLGIDFAAVSNVSAAMKKYFGEEAKKAIADREGYFKELNRKVREAGEDISSNVIHGANNDVYQQQKQEEAEAKKNPNNAKAKEDDYGIGE